MAYLRRREFEGMPAVLDRYPHLIDKPEGCRAMAGVLRQTGNVDTADDLERWADYVERQG